jgi:yecA family protein
MSTERESIDYDDLERRLESAGAVATPAEVHGLMAGLMVGRVSDQGWLDQIFNETPDPRDLSVRECVQALDALAVETREQLNDAVLGFDLILPPDDRGLDERTRELAAWVQGYLFGLGLGGAERILERGGDAAEILSDLEQISRAQAEGEGSESEETAYAELVEYVRVGVLLINEELNPVPVAPRSQ